MLPPLVSNLPQVQPICTAMPQTGICSLFGATKYHDMYNGGKDYHIGSTVNMALPNVLTCKSVLHDRSRKRRPFSLASTGGTLVSLLSLRLSAVRLDSLDRSGKCILIPTAVGSGAPDSLCSAKPQACSRRRGHVNAPMQQVMQFVCNVNADVYKEWTDFC